MIRYLTLAVYYWLAEQVIGVDADTLARASRSELADSALLAPQVGFGDVEYYLDLYGGLGSTAVRPTGCRVRIA